MQGEAQYLGAFHSTKNSVLYFRKLLVANERAFSTNSGKEDNLASYTQILEHLLSEISIPLDFHPAISGISG